MKKIFLLSISFIALQNSFTYAFDPKEAFVTPRTSYFYTEKDSRQFQEFRGVKRGFEAGIDQLEFSKMLGKTLELDFSGHALFRNNDYNILIDLKNSSDPSKFKLKTGFLSFNRYYDPTGGMYANATTPSYDLTEKLTLFDGQYFIEAEFPLFGLQTTTKGTWHHKEGKISELTWGFGTQAANRKYAPSFSEIDQNVYEAELSFKKEITNGDLTLGQHFIYMDDKPVRREFDKNTASESVVQSINGDSFNYAAHISLFKALSEKTLTTLSYTVGFGDTTEKENLETFNSTGGRVGGGTRKNYFGALADNDTQKHILNAHLYREPFNNLSMNLRLNTFYKERYSDSTYPRDTSATPDLIIDETATNNTEHSGYGVGEHLSFHYKGLNRWTPYLKLESEQNFLRLDEDTISVTASDNFSRVTDQEVFKSLGAIGFYSYPWNWFKLSAEYSLNQDRDDYKDISETASSSGTEKSGFVDDITRFSNAVKTNVSLALTPWLQTGLRYQWKRTRFAMTPQSGLSSTKGYSNAHQYTALFSILPQSEFSLVQLFSLNDSDTRTQASTVSTARLPRHQGDYKSLITSFDYHWSSALNFSLQHDFSWSNNFDDFSATGLPLGVDDKYENFLLDVSWKLKSMTLTPSYGFGFYRTENKAHVDDYDYHSAMIKLTCSL
ncbi:MAG: hypothetical protein HYW85_06690 [Deltaproteobacteria bacterium]|nr:hypothetical protein [Deltaproteobacteria bacterium]MBI3016569.1 hypothetical protein [Deltaproteobacteria bacterium]